MVLEAVLWPARDVLCHLSPTGAELPVPGYKHQVLFFCPEGILLQNTVGTNTNCGSM
jgi:hypothetical protein